MITAQVTCPSCFENFSIPLDEGNPEGSEIDYDCEVCCRPMIVTLFSDGAEARSLDDL